MRLLLAIASLIVVTSIANAEQNETLIKQSCIVATNLPEARQTELLPPGVCPIRYNNSCYDKRFGVQVTNICGSDIRIEIVAGKKSRQTGIQSNGREEYYCLFARDDCTGIQVWQLSSAVSKDKDEGSANEPGGAGSDSSDQPPTDPMKSRLSEAKKRVPSYKDKAKANFDYFNNAKEGSNEVWRKELAKEREKLARDLDELRKNQDRVRKQIQADNRWVFPDACRNKHAFWANVYQVGKQHCNFSLDNPGASVREIYDHCHQTGEWACDYACEGSNCDAPP